jgi:two-component system sensor histidine kinase KdpD
MICGFGESCFDKERSKYFPIKSSHKMLGVLEVDCIKGDISKEEQLCIDTLFSQLTIAAEREMLSASEEINRLNIEKEKLRNNLLRSISHDLRTPLTGISGGANFLAESLATLDTETIKSLLNDISCDASWLSNLVDNLLNMTRIQDGKLLIKLKNEVVDDILAEAVARIIKRGGKHIIKTSKPKEIMLVPMDGQLIIQVLVNLLDNSIKHTKDNSEIQLSSYSRQGNMVFEVSDNGGGIRAEIMDNLFESFVSGGDSQRGMGLGLSICQAIIKAHNGNISAENNDKGGATFRFTLPLEVKLYE